MSSTSRPHYLVSIETPDRHESPLGAFSRCSVALSFSQSVLSDSRPLALSPSRIVVLSHCRPLAFSVGRSLTFSVGRSLSWSFSRILVFSFLVSSANIPSLYPLSWLSPEHLFTFHSQFASSWWYCLVCKYLHLVYLLLLELTYSIIPTTKDVQSFNLHSVSVMLTCILLKALYYLGPLLSIARFQYFILG